MHEWRSGLDFPFEQEEPPPPVDRDLLLVDNLRLQAEVAELERRLGQATAGLQRLSTRLMDLERHTQRAAGAVATVTALHAQLVAAQAALVEADARTAEAEARAAQAEARAAEAEARLRALEATRVLRYSAGARSLYGRLRGTS